MSKITIEDFEEMNDRNMQANANRDMNRVRYFSLKNNKDEAIVRFLIDSVQDIDIEGVHKMDINGKSRNVNCKRKASDPMDMCPLCKANIKLDYRMYIPMIVYDRDETGQIIASPVIWERPTSFREKMKEYLRNYGPLSGLLFRVIRNGQPGDRSTTYDFFELRSEAYPQELYPLNRDLFKDFDLMNGMIVDLDENEMMQALRGETIERLLPKTDDMQQSITNNNYNTPMSNTTQSYNNNNYNNNGYNNNSYNNNNTSYGDPQSRRSRTY